MAMWMLMMHSIVIESVGTDTPTLAIIRRLFQNHYSMRLNESLKLQFQHLIVKNFVHLYVNLMK